MSTRNLLVVATVPVDNALLRDQIRQFTGGADVRVKVVAPAADLSPLEWLVSDEDEARAEALSVAEDTAAAVEEEATSVEAGVGDSDPVQAIEDALRTFPADELVLVTREGSEAGWLEKDSAGEAFDRFGLPVKHLAVRG